MAHSDRIAGVMFNPEPTCENCVYRRAIACHHSPPQYDAYRTYAVWPIIKLTDWCGKWSDVDPDSQ